METYLLDQVSHHLDLLWIQLYSVLPSYLSSGQMFIPHEKMVE